jgi:3'-phosphoadenosine 5'-phosphosulfate sulfotransferase (PAPS reductase)/FAD synthetase
MNIIKKTHQTILRLIENDTPIIIAWSGGKDSSCVLNCTLTAAVEAKRCGQVLPPIFVTTADTGIENPEIHRYLLDEIQKVERYAKEMELPVQAHVARPEILDRWSVKTVGKRSLPTFPDSRRRECSSDMKVKPLLKLRRRLLESLPEGMMPVTLVGTRRAESRARAQNMKRRGESDSEARVDSVSGERYLSPIAEWSHDDVWCYLADCAAGKTSSYSDFQETMRIYKEATGEG